MPEAVLSKNGNLIIPKALLPDALSLSDVILVAYSKEQNSILFTDAENPFFLTHYPGAQQQIFKIKNLKGDRVIACHDILIDHDLEMREGPLEYRIIQKNRVFQIYCESTAH